MDRTVALIPVSENPFNAESPFEALAGARTPSDLFFVRNHFPVPDLSPKTFRLSVGGAVERPLTLGLDEIRAHGAAHLDVTIECAGNARATLSPQPAGTPWGWGAVATARFTGAPLHRVLAAAAPRAAAVEVLFVGADAGATKTGAAEPYARSLPMAIALHPDTLLVWAMNDEPLTPDHGRPLRVVVPGWYGMASVKWLREIRVLEEPFRGFFQADDYVFREREGTPDETPVTKMAPRALILSPREGATLSSEAEVRGMAWSGGVPVTRVEVSADDGATWSDAELSPATSPYAARDFRVRVPVRAGRVVLAARATDANGTTQPEQPVWNLLGYVNNGWHRVEAHAK